MVVLQVIESWGTRFVGERQSRNEVLETWFQQHYSSLTAVAHLMLGDRSQAEEVVMDAFAKAMLRWRLFKNLDVPYVYLRRVVVNNCRGKLRRRKVELKAAVLIDADEPARADTESQGARLDVWRAIADLPGRQRACIALRYLDDRSEAEVAEILEMPLGTVKSQLSRARARLSSVLGDNDDL